MWGFKEKTFMEEETNIYWTPLLGRVDAACICAVSEHCRREGPVTSVLQMRNLKVRLGELPKAAWFKQSGQVQPRPQLPLSLWSLPAPKCSPTPRNCNYHGLGPDQSQRVSGHSSKDHLHEWDMRSQFQRTGWDQLKLENLHITCECDLKDKNQKNPDIHTKTCFHPLLKVMELQ